MTTKDTRASKAAETIHPDYIYRKAQYGRQFFGYGPTQLDEKIRRGEIPAPVKLSGSGRAEGWFGHQILAHHAALKARSI